MFEEKNCSILIPVFNGYEQVKRCFNSILKYTPECFPIILLDDASTDTRLLSWLDEIENLYPHASVIHSDENLGFVGNVNRGMALTKGDVVILNSDTMVTKGWINKLIECGKSNPAIGIVCPLSNNATILSVPLMNRVNFIPQDMSIDEFAEIVERSSRKQYPRLPVAVGFCMLITRAVIDRIGFLHRAFYKGYGEECDFSLRAWQAGFEIACSDNTFIYHEGESSFSTITGIEEVKRRNESVLISRWPCYRQIISQFCRTNPLRQAQERIMTEVAHARGDQRAHILHVLHAYKVLGGTELHSSSVVEGVSKDFRVTVFFPNNIEHEWTDLSTTFENDGRRICGYQKANIDGSPRLMGHIASVRNSVVESSFKNFIQGGDYSIIHFQHLLGWGTLELPLLAKRCGAQVVLTLHDYYLLCPIYDLIRPEGKRCGKTIASPQDTDCVKCLKAYLQFDDSAIDLSIYLMDRNKKVEEIFEYVDLVISPSKYVYDKFTRAFGKGIEKKIKIIPHGIKKLNRVKGQSIGNLLKLGIVANLSIRKGAKIVLKLIELLNKDQVEISHFGGVSEEYIHKFRETGIQLRGPYQVEQLSNLLKDIDLVLVPSIYEETYCLTISEVQSLSIPVIAFKIGAIPERIIDGITGFLVAQETVEALADRIKDIINNPKILNRIRDRLRSIRFKSEEDNIGEYLRVYNNILDKEINFNFLKNTTSLEEKIDQNNESIDHIKSIFLMSKKDWFDGDNFFGTQEYRTWVQFQIDMMKYYLVEESNSWIRKEIGFIIIERDRFLGGIENTLEYFLNSDTIFSDLLVVSLFDPIPLKKEITNSIVWKKINHYSQESRIINQWLLGSSSTWVAWVMAGDKLDDFTDKIVRSYLKKNQNWRFVYTDEDCISEDGRRYSPLFKPDCNIDYLRSKPYIGNLCLVEKKSFLQVGGLLPYRDGGLFDICLKVIDEYGEASVGHIPHVLYHCADYHAYPTSSEGSDMEYQKVIAAHLGRNHLTGRINKTTFDQVYWVDYAFFGKLSISLMIMTKDNQASVQELVKQIVGISAHEMFRNILVVDFEESSQSKNIWLENQWGLKIKKVRAVCNTNISLALNNAINLIKSDHVLVIHDGVRFISKDKIFSLVGLCVRTDVGIVSPCILNTMGEILHSYCIIGFGPLGIMDQLYKGQRLGVGTYMDRDVVMQNCIGICDHAFLLKKSFFDQIGGFNHESYPNIFFMLDFSLRLSELGIKIVWTPHAPLLEIDKGSLNQHRKLSINVVKVGEELVRIYNDWLPRLARDPTYNVNLSLRNMDWQPTAETSGAWDNVIINRKRVIGFPDNRWGSGYYRVIDPLNHLHETQEICRRFIEGGTIHMPNAVEMERMSPDVLLIHNGLHNQHLNALQLYHQYSNAFKVFSLDDLITDLPNGNPFKKTNYPDIDRRLCSALKFCDRLLVTTELLVEAYSSLINDIRIVPNYLSKSRWSYLDKFTIEKIGKPRIGWAGAMQHEADLLWLLPVMEELKNEVEWFFLGMCPEPLEKYVSVAIPMVDFNKYPAKLASLGLDIAIAPLVYNKFNQCKSNLRLLEYGILGISTICTDIEPYKGAPVERLENSPRLWVNSLRERIHDLEATKKEGNNLKVWVESNWLINDHIEIWMKALTP